MNLLNLLSIVLNISLAHILHGSMDNNAKFSEGYGLVLMIKRDVSFDSYSSIVQKIKNNK